MDGAPRHKSKGSRGSTRRARGAAQAASVLPKGGGMGINGTSSSSSSSSSCASDFDTAAGLASGAAAAALAAATATAAAAAAAAASRPVSPAQPPVAANTVAADRERFYLDIFTGTIGKFVPLVSEEALSAALRERQRLPQAVAAAVGAERVACEQAQVGGRFLFGCGRVSGWFVVCSPLVCCGVVIMLLVVPG